MSGVAIKPKLLVLELWGLGDLVIATPFLQAAAKQFSITLVAKPFALELRPRLWPEIEVLPFNAPWTAFRRKYYFWNWPWRTMTDLRRQLVAKEFDFGISARWDPRDHLILKLSGARERIGFPRLFSQRLLTRPQQQPDVLAHRSEFWQVTGRSLGLSVPTREGIIPPVRTAQSLVVLHSGARLSARVWPLENFQYLAAKLREKKIPVQVACDPDQLTWWEQQGEAVLCPRNVTELFALVDGAGAFIGNCSGPGHLAAICGVPTFTIYGPSLHEWFIPMHPGAVAFEGQACPYKPCSDYCRYSRPFCLCDVSAAEVWPQVEMFAQKNLLGRMNPILSK